MVSVGTPAGLHNVPLGRIGGKTGGRPTSHHIDNNTGYLCYAGKTEIFLHEGKSGSAGGSHGFSPRQTGTYYSSEAGDFIFHLDKGAFHLRQPVGENLADLRGRSYGIARKETATGSQGSLNDSLVSL